MKEGSTFPGLKAGSSRMIHLIQVTFKALVVNADLGPDVRVYGTIGPMTVLYGPG